MTLNEVLTLTISSISLVTSIFAVLYSRKEKVLFMEGSNSLISFHNVTKLNFEWSNNTEKNVTNLSIMCVCFDDQLNEISKQKIEDLYLNPICNNSQFHYSFPISVIQQYIRISFIGSYKSIVPFITRKMNQVFWYSLLPITDQQGNIIGFEIQSTYKTEINQLKSKNESLLNAYDKEFKKKRK